MEQAKKDDLHSNFHRQNVRHIQNTLPPALQTQNDGSRYSFVFGVVLLK
jgi:hypothetical protein